VQVGEQMNGWMVRRAMGCSRKAVGQEGSQERFTIDNNEVKLSHHAREQDVDAWQGSGGWSRYGHCDFDFDDVDLRLRSVPAECKPVPERCMVRRTNSTTHLSRYFLPAWVLVVEA
jgi:hypothetical protein